MSESLLKPYLPWQDPLLPRPYTGDGTRREIWYGMDVVVKDLDGQRRRWDAWEAQRVARRRCFCGLPLCPRGHCLACAPDWRHDGPISAVWRCCP